MVLLSMQNVNKSFGLNVVLKNINMTLKEGQKMGLVGVNGSGKSTLLKLITGELHPDAPNPDPGTISLMRGATVGILTQFADIESNLTVVEELSRVFDPLKQMDIEIEISTITSFGTISSDDG